VCHLFSCMKLYNINQTKLVEMGMRDPCGVGDIWGKPLDKIVQKE